MNNKDEEYIKDLQVLVLDKIKGTESFKEFIGQSSFDRGNLREAIQATIEIYIKVAVKETAKKLIS